MNYREKCRNCNEAFLQQNLYELGPSPHANSLEKKENRFKSTLYPLSLYNCKKCYLVQGAVDFSSIDIFKNDYPYLSSQSQSFLDHWNNSLSKIINKYSLNSNSHILEIASNDGYLQDLFLKKNLIVIGVEPSPEPAEISVSKGNHVIQEFFTANLSK